VPARSISPARRLAGMAMVRFVGVRNAARAVQVDERTLRGWLAKDNADTDHDADAWRAAEALAQERMLTGLATGDARGLTAWSTAAGIASRNVRYATLIARREGRHREEPKPSWWPAWQALSMDRRRLMVDTLRYIREHPPTDATPADGPEPTMDAWVTLVAKMTDREVAREGSRLARRFARADPKPAGSANGPLQRHETAAEAPGVSVGQSDPSSASAEGVAPVSRRDLLRLIRQRPEEVPNEPHPLHRKGRGTWVPFSGVDDDQ
jgi:hypothetical protein